MENSSTVVTHRVVREFTSDGFVHSVGDLVSDAGWTHQGKQYVESMGWVVPLTAAEIVALNTATEMAVEPEPEVVEEATEVAPEPVKESPKPKRGRPPKPKPVEPGTIASLDEELQPLPE
jgi:hypothetical protein